MSLFGRSRKSPPTEPVDASTGTEQVPQESVHEAISEDAAPSNTMTVEMFSEFIVGRTKPMQPFGVSVLSALGLPLCEPIISDLDVPHFDSASAAGYGVRAEDIARASDDQPVTLAVVGEIGPGDVAEDGLAPRTAMLVGAGAPIPAGVDTVVPFRLTDGGVTNVAVRGACEVGFNIRRKGADVADGDTIALLGDVITPKLAGVLAGIGIDRILVRPRPRVVVLSFAQDTVDPGKVLTHRGQSYDAASSYIVAAANEAGAIAGAPVELNLADDTRALRQILSDQMIRADLIITTGGTEPVDGLLPSVLEKDHGAHFVTVDLNPGSEYGFALLDGTTPMLMLPSGLTAAATGFTTFGYPLLRRLQGLTDDTAIQTEVAGRLFTPTIEGDATFIPVKVENGQIVRAGAPHTELQAMNESDGLAIVREHVAAGEDIRFIPWPTTER